MASDCVARKRHCDSEPSNAEAEATDVGVPVQRHEDVGHQCGVASSCEHSCNLVRGEEQNPDEQGEEYLHVLHVTSMSSVEIDMQWPSLSGLLLHYTGGQGLSP